jgi:hypothetical protein
METFDIVWDNINPEMWPKLKSTGGTPAKFDILSVEQDEMPQLWCGGSRGVGHRDSV